MWQITAGAEGIQTSLIRTRPAPGLIDRAHLTCMASSNSPTAQLLAGLFEVSFSSYSVNAITSSSCSVMSGSCLGAVLSDLGMLVCR